MLNVNVPVFVRSNHVSKVKGDGADKGQLFLSTIHLVTVRLDHKGVGKTRSYKTGWINNE